MLRALGSDTTGATTSYGHWVLGFMTSPTKLRLVISNTRQEFCDILHETRNMINVGHLLHNELKGTVCDGPWVLRLVV